MKTESCTASSSWRRWALAVMVLFTAPSAMASAYQGYVSNVHALGGKVMVLVTNGMFDGAPASCGSDANGMRFMIDPATPYGRSMLALSLSAKLSGRMVWAGGDSNCSGGIEGMYSIDLKG